MPDIHLKFGGSTIRRSINCPAWHNISAKAPKIDRESAAAARGTKLHNIMEEYYDSELEREFATHLENYPELPQGDQEACTIAHQALEHTLDKFACDEVLVEPFVQLHEDTGGSADVLACSDEVALVVDYKFGHVPVTHTEQFKFYALAALHTDAVADMLEDKRVISAVIQPEVSNFALLHEHSEKELHAFRQDVEAARKNAKTAKVGNPGDWCKYCPGAAYCEAKKAQVDYFLEDEGEALESLAESAAMIETMKEHIKAVERELLFNLEAGRPVEGFKLVEKQQRRGWTQEDEALQVFKRSKLRKEIYLEPDKLRSPAQMEKALKAAEKKYDIEPLVTKASTGTTFAPVTDKRDPVIVRGDAPAALDKIIGKTG